MKWLDGITNSMDMSLSKFIQEVVKEREAMHAATHGVAKSHYLVTEQQQNSSCLWPNHFLGSKVPNSEVWG